MTVLAQLLIAAALVATAVIYGTDVFAAIVLRPALAQRRGRGNCARLRFMSYEFVLRHAFPHDG